MGATFSERFNCTNRDLLKKPVFEKGDAIWVDVLTTITKQYNKRIHFSTKLTPGEASLKNNEGFVYKNLLDKRTEGKPKFHVNDLVRRADLKRAFSKGFTYNWSYKTYKIKETVNDTKPSYKINDLKDRYNEALVKKAELTLKEKKDVMETLSSN